MRALGGYQASRKQNASGCFYISISKVCRPIFQTVSWVQRNEVIISNLKVHWRRSISRLSVHDNTAAKIFVRLSVQGLFFCVLERFTFFFGAISFSQSALLSF